MVLSTNLKHLLILFWLGRDTKRTMLPRLFASPYEEIFWPLARDPRLCISMRASERDMLASLIVSSIFPDEV